MTSNRHELTAHAVAARAAPQVKKRPSVVLPPWGYELGEHERRVSKDMDQ
jgi:hypothetical protein